MTMERRVLLAIFLALVVMTAWQAFFVKPAPKPAAGTKASAPQAAVAVPTAQPAPAPAPTDAPTPAAPTAAPIVGEAAVRDVPVETDRLIAVFTNRGGRLKSLRLKQYLDQNRQPQELIAPETAATHPLPFSLTTSDPATTRSLNNALYSVTSSASADGTPGAANLRFEYQDSSGLHVVKSFRLDPDSFIITFAETVTNGDHRVPVTIEWGPAVGDSGENSRYIKKAEALFFENGKVTRLGPKDIAKQPTHQGDFRYAGVDDNYFMTVALFPGPSTVTFQVATIPPPAGSSDPARDLVSYAIAPADPSQPLKFFAGPKDFDVLKAIGDDVASAIDFGMFKVLVVPLLRSLKWVNGFVGNYGWSIIILTIIINAIMFPLRHKSVVSMRKLQEIQPEANAIQARYAKLKATDPAKQKMNEELMALYRQRGVNPASGCVPMLLSFPVLLAMWALLQTSIELRGAPWVGWIHDLSAHDPLYITPILMGVSQFWQQRITPAGGDPAQQKMMMFMPVMFTAMFLWAPAGLAIYYGVSNFWGIGQQYLTNYLIGPPKVRAVRPPAERVVKRTGTNKPDGSQ